MLGLWEGCVYILQVSVYKLVKWCYLLLCHFRKGT